MNLNSQTATTAIQRPQRIVKSGMVYDPGMPGIVDGVVIDADDLARLANWMCTWDTFNHHANEPVRLREELNEAGGFCDRCRDKAALLLSECPYIDMNRSTEVKIENEQ